MTHAEQLYEALAAERAKGPIGKEKWLEIAQAAFDAAPSGKPVVGVKPKYSRAFLDDLFNALCDVQGVAPHQITRSMTGCIVDSRKQILEATPNVTGEEIARRAALYRRRHPTWPCTATSLCKYWGEFAPLEKTAMAQNDLYQEPSGDWHSTVMKMFSLETFPEGWDNWQNVPINYRAAIKKETKF